MDSSTTFLPASAALIRLAGARRLFRILRPLDDAFLMNLPVMGSLSLRCIFLIIKMKDKRAKDKHTNKGVNKESLQLKNDGTEYAQIVKMLGAGRVDAKCFSDGVVRQCTICGRMRKKVWISVGDIVLVSLRDFQDHKGDIVHKYAPDESRQLKAMGEIPSTIRVNEVADMGGEEADNEEDTDDFDFDAI